MVRIEIEFGALADDINSQLRAQGFSELTRHTAKHWQQDADAVTRLAVRGLLTEAMVKRARCKLLDRVLRSVDQ